MKKYLLLTLMFTLLPAYGQMIADGTYGVNVAPQRSHLIWRAYKLIGSGHNGKVFLKEGQISFQGGKVSGAKFTFDLNTITCDDVKKPKANQSLVGHLKSPDFFDVAKFPTATFVATSIKNRKSGVSLKGNLTIKGQTKEVRIKNIALKNGRYRGVLSIDRSEYGIVYNSKKLGNVLKNRIIKDKVDFEFVISVAKKML